MGQGLFSIRSKISTQNAIRALLNAFINNFGIRKNNYFVNLCKQTLGTKKKKEK